MNICNEFSFVIQVRPSISVQLCVVLRNFQDFSLQSTQFLVCVFTKVISLVSREQTLASIAWQRETDRQTERQRDRETEGQRDRGTERQRDRETEREREREREREGEIASYSKGNLSSDEEKRNIREGGCGISEGGHEPSGVYWCRLIV